MILILILNLNLAILLLAILILLLQIIIIPSVLLLLINKNSNLITLTLYTISKLKQQIKGRHNQGLNIQWRTQISRQIIILQTKLTLILVRKQILALKLPGFRQISQILITLEINLCYLCLYPLKAYANQHVFISPLASSLNILKLTFYILIQLELLLKILSLLPSPINLYHRILDISQIVRRI